jgi:hypothetical protein
MNWFKVSPIMAAHERCLNYLRGELKLAFRKKWIWAWLDCGYFVFESEKLRVYLYRQLPFDQLSCKNDRLSKIHLQYVS